MLETGHGDKCVFRRYVGCWLKVMRRLYKQHNENISILRNGEQGHNTSLDNAETIVEHSVFVPPYLLPLSNQFLVFEDISDDGSVTFEKIQLESSTIMKDLQRRLDFEVSLPDALKNFVAIPSKISCRRDTQQTANLLATFGWHYDHSNNDSGGNCVKCNICLSRALLPSRKRRLNEVKTSSEMDNAKLHLVNSHRVHCPYVSGFSFNAEHKSDAGWKVVVENLVKYAKRQKNDGVVELADLWGVSLS